MPNYNADLFIKEAVTSVLAQEYPDFELVIVDDHSTDESWDIIQNYAKKDDRVRAFQNSENLGIPKTRNELLRQVSPRATYIAILDSDDVMLEERLATQVAFLEEHMGIAAVGSWVSLIDKTGDTLGARTYPPNPTAKEALRVNPLAQSAVMIRKRVVDELGEYDEYFARAQDHEYWLRLLMHRECVANIQKVLTKYRIHKKEGLYGRDRVHLWYALRVRMRYLLHARFFSLKGCIIVVGYILAGILSMRLAAIIRKYFHTTYETK